MVDHIPADIWLHIAGFIPDASLQNMLSVNSLFFEIAMTIRYREVSFNALNRMTRKTLSRLADLSVAQRVQRLRVQLNLFKLQQPEITQSQGSIIRRIGAVWHRALVNRLPAKSILLGDVSTLSKTELVQGLTAVFPGLMNLKEFSIYSCHYPGCFDLQPFFSAAWSSFGRNLRKIQLGGNIENFRVFLASCPPLDFVQQVDLEFTNDPSRDLPDSESASDATILLDLVAPFINDRSLQLHSLKICSWASIDLSEFFMRLGPLPALRHLGIRAAFNRSFRTDPSGLSQLLSSTSPTLQELELRLNPTGMTLDQTSEVLLSEWLAETVANDAGICANIQELQLYPTCSAVGLDALLVCVRRSALKKLVVRDRYLHQEEIETIIGALMTSSLRSLRLNVLVLSADLIDLLAKNLPELRYLTLHVGHPIMGGPGSTIEDFRAKMQTRLYKDWKLYDIDIWQGGSELASDTMHLIASQIPSIRSFWGTGDKEIVCR